VPVVERRYGDCEELELPPLAGNSIFALVLLPPPPISEIPISFHSPTTGTWKERALPPLAGLLLSGAFAASPANPFDFAYGPVWSYVALVPLFLRLGICIAAQDSIRHCFRQGWISGAVFSLLTLYWVAFTQGGGPAVIGGTLLLAAYLGLFYGVFAASLSALIRSFGTTAWLAAPFLWTACEYVLARGELGFPWLLLGHSQANAPSLIQYAEFSGVYGVSFWIICVNVCVFALISLPLQRQRISALGTLALLFLLPWLCGIALQRSSQRMRVDSGIKVAVVQNNIGLDKWQPGGRERSLVSLERLSRQAAVEEPRLIVWPETALPCRVGPGSACGGFVENLVNDTGIPILTGAPGRNESGGPINAAYLFANASGVSQSYAKMHLVPFGERTPFVDSIPFLSQIDWTAITGDLGPAEFARGERRTLFEFDLDGGRLGRFALLICFESVFPDFVRLSVLEGAGFLVNITNDSWFGATAGPFQHAQLAVLRAVENRIAIARCATSGISLFIDPFGRTTQETDIYTATYRVGQIEVATERTFYTRHGDLFAQFALIASCLALGAVIWRRRTARRDERRVPLSETVSGTE